jgi:hypothetical protein
MWGNFQIPHARARGRMTDRDWRTLSAKERTTAIYKVIQAMDAESGAQRALHPHDIRLRADDDGPDPTIVSRDAK